MLVYYFVVNFILVNIEYNKNYTVYYTHVYGVFYTTEKLYNGTMSINNY